MTKYRIICWDSSDPKVNPTDMTYDEMIKTFKELIDRNPLYVYQVVRKKDDK